MSTTKISGMVIFFGALCLIATVFTGIGLGINNRSAKTDPNLLTAKPHFDLFIQWSMANAAFVFGILITLAYIIIKCTSGIEMWGYLLICAISTAVKIAQLFLTYQTYKDMHADDSDSSANQEEKENPYTQNLYAVTVADICITCILIMGLFWYVAIEKSEPYLFNDNYVNRIGNNTNYTDSREDSREQSINNIAPPPSPVFNPQNPLGSRMDWADPNKNLYPDRNSRLPPVQR
jgi:hypothetical protein